LLDVTIVADVTKSLSLQHDGQSLSMQNEVLFERPRKVAFQFLNGLGKLFPNRFLFPFSIARTIPQQP
jgi:hypothetical protein